MCGCSRGARCLRGQHASGADCANLAAMTKLHILHSKSKIMTIPEKQYTSATSSYLSKWIFII